MAELMVSCFRFDGWAAHEMELCFGPSPRVDLFCSKQPSDLTVANAYLKRDSGLWVICMLRDPRDTVVSRHRKRPDAYWSYLGTVRHRFDILERVTEEERFIRVRYEDLVAEPDAVQQRLREAMPFLEYRHAFSEFHTVSDPSPDSVAALNGVRAISAGSVGRWRSELPRLAAQIERHGPIDDILRALEYEENTDWASILDGVTPDNGDSFWEDRRKRTSGRARIERLKKKMLKWRALMGFPKRRPIVLAQPR